MKIVFLIQNLYGIGGTIRSTVNLTAALAERHEVEVVSILRTADQPSFDIDARVRVRDLVDLRESSPDFAGDDPRQAQPSEDAARGDTRGHHHCSLLTDQRMAAYLAECDADMVIATRPALLAYLAKYGTRRYLKVGQEHWIHNGHSQRLRADLRELCPDLDVLVTVSEGDAEVYRTKMPFADTAVVSIPNSVPQPKVGPSTLDTKTIVAAGRLITVKRYPLLIEAFAKVAAERPDWRLRLYGKGPEAPHLQQVIDDLGLNGRALMMGPRSPIETEWAKGSIAAVSSQLESFGMTIVEAMRCGVPVVSVDCPYGPGEIISHGNDGLLVPEATPSALADALLRLIEDEPLRHAMGAAALRNAQRFDPAEIALRYERLYAEHMPARRVRGLARLRDLGARTIAGARSLVPRKAADQPLAAQAPVTTHCLVRQDGGLTIRLIREPWATGALATNALALRHRGTATTIELPLVPAEDGAMEARLDRGAHRLAEGRWDVYQVRPGKRRRRLAAGLCDSRALVNAFPDLRRPLETWTPYATDTGELSLAVRARTMHAEVTDVVSASTGLTVHGLLINLPEGRPALTLLAVRRVARRAAASLDQDELTAPSLDEETAPSLDQDEETAPLLDQDEQAASSLDQDDVPGARIALRAQSHLDGRFSCSMPYQRLLEARSHSHEVWDLYLRPGEEGQEGEPIRLGRFCDDIAERKGVERYPHQQVEDALIRPFYTAGNELSVRVIPPPVEDESPV
ncbi:glycosyltransferase family 4 protein [Nonomuraea dietziae]|uniref:Glycosyltransferase involved in cell wall biosynthesis n=1 Tax=Nonomuraea dietziae TaxID=65515 RepID=A0A7W5YEW0_9ACTN|nr:glycosyltransferase family 4 protein [Nonomuraea dietziae]MBB3732188.1 glycosyltransferase involved in cell wall biosynthesis [Nonomuraea dietziae]